MDTSIVISPANSVDLALSNTYLKFKIDQYISAVFPMENVQEVIVVPLGRIAPMPNMAECVLGLLNRCNKVLWVIDLAQLLNLKIVDANAQQYHIIIIRVGQIPLALVMQEIEGVIRCNIDEIKPPQATAPSILPYLNGCILQQQETLLVLNAEAIINAPVLHSSASG